MSEQEEDLRRERDSREGWSAADAAFVRRIAEHYRPPEPTRAYRAVFRAALDERLARRRPGAWLPLAAGLAAASAALLLAVSQTGTDPVSVQPEATRIASAVGAAEETLLVLAAPDAELDESLPEEYEAIAGLFLGEV